MYNSKIQDEFGQRQVRTPQPTPKSSPVMSPVRMKSPPLTPPASPHLQQGVPVTIQRQPIVVQPEYESEISESVDISEEIRQLQGSSLFYHYIKESLNVCSMKG